MDDKYTKLLDAETRKFIFDTGKFYPDNAVESSIEEQREFYDALCRAYNDPYPKGVTASDRWMSARETSFQVRDYTKEDTEPEGHILYFHGGGFILGGLESHDSICAEFCSSTGYSVTAVDYRLAPEFPHPAAFDDCLTAFLRVSAETQLPIIIVGDSAGGNLAAAVSHATRKLPRRPKGQVLIYPALGGDKSVGSYLEHANAPGLTLADIEFYVEQRGKGADLVGDVTANPLHDNDFSALPPTVIFTAECDPLSDDGRGYRDRIIAAGGKAAWINEKGLIHGYLRARNTVKLAEASFERMTKATIDLCTGNWNWD